MVPKSFGQVPIVTLQHIARTFCGTIVQVGNDYLIFGGSGGSDGNGNGNGDGNGNGNGNVCWMGGNSRKTEANACKCRQMDLREYCLHNILYMNSD